MKRFRHALVVPAIAGLMLSGFTPAFATIDPVDETLPINSTGIPAKYAEQPINWHPCADDELPSKPPAGAENIQCATYLTPRDWTNLADTRDLTIAISRLPATGTATQSLFINPGGPGAAGRIWPVKLRNQSRVRANQEVIGFDPRGTGMSTTITCGGALDNPEYLDPRDRDPANLSRILDVTKEAVGLCKERSGDLGPLITTDQTIRDIDLLRVLLNRPKINWVGYSAGTWMGAYYAQRFPERAGRFLLDSPVEFTTTWQKAFDWQPMSFERRWRQDFLPWMAKYDKLYHFGTTADAVRETFEQVRAKLRARPVDYGGLKVGPNILDSFAAEGIYAKSQFPGTATMLVDIRTLTEQTASADERAAAANRISSARRQEDVLIPRLGAAAADSYPTAFWTIRCNEGPWTGDRDSVVVQSQQYLDKQQTLVGGKWMVQPCIYWDKPRPPLPVIDGKGVPPVLMLHSEHDPATAIEGGRRAHAAFAGSRMVTVTGEGDHGLYATSGANNNKTLDGVVQDFLADGVLPPADMTVPGMPLPVPPGA